jgi:hypothetical protein
MIFKTLFAKVHKLPSLFFLIIIIGAGLRLYGTDFGLPDLLHLDEPFEINRALRLATGSFDLSRAGKGGFYYIIFVEFVFMYLALYITGITNSPIEFAYFFVNHEDMFYLMARITSALIGTISLYLIYRIGCKNGGKTVGLIAMFLLAISTLNITHAHFATVDITLIFFLLLTWTYLFAIVEEGNKKDFYLAGLFGGLSLITKFHAILIVVPMTLAYFLRLRRSTSSGKYHRYFAFSTILFFLVTFAGEPGYVKTFLNIDRTVESLYGTTDRNASENNTTQECLRESSNINLYKFYTNIITKDIGFPLLIIFLISLIYFLFRRSAVEILVLSFSIPYFIAICSTSTSLYFGRYVLPLIPLIILVASRGLGKSIEYLHLSVKRLSYVQVNGIVLSIIVLLCFPNFLSGLAVSSQFREENTRIQAKKWIETTISAGSTILMEGSPEHRSQRLVPIVNCKTNIRRMMNDLQNRDPGKKRYWELRSGYLDNCDIPRYDLILVQNDQSWTEYEEFKLSDIEYVILDVKFLQNVCSKRTDPACLTRVAFYERLVIDPELTKIAEFDSRVEIFKKNPPKKPD